MIRMRTINSGIDVGREALYREIAYECTEKCARVHNFLCILSIDHRELKSILV